MSLKRSQARFRRMFWNVRSECLQPTWGHLGVAVEEDEVLRPAGRVAYAAVARVDEAKVPLVAECDQTVDPSKQLGCRVGRAVIDNDDFV